MGFSHTDFYNVGRKLYLRRLEVTFKLDQEKLPQLGLVSNTSKAPALRRAASRLII